MTLEERNKETVRSLFEECINQGRLELLPQFIAAGYQGAQGEYGPSGFARSIAGLRSGFPDIQYSIEDLLAAGDRVAVRWTWSGTHTGTFRTFLPTHRRVTNSGIAVFQLHEGKLFRAWLESDRLGFLEQISATPVQTGTVPAQSGEPAVAAPGKTAPSVKHIDVYIDRPANEVYAFASNPQNLVRWATGLGDSIERVDGEWITDSPMGKVKIRLAERNTLGILDHEVILESGAEVYNPMRVIPHGQVCEVVFTLIRLPQTSAEKFRADAAWVEKDLMILKSLLERRSRTTTKNTRRREEDNAHT